MREAVLVAGLVLLPCLVYFIWFEQLRGLHFDCALFLIIAASLALQPVLVLRALRPVGRGSTRPAVAAEGSATGD